ncbi:MAG: hypothetical protein LBU14_01300 [Candidatus Peribacteria bacterium]|nr:hypothetical protein [Candidatus Peribacteria bacterium]
MISLKIKELNDDRLGALHNIDSSSDIHSFNLVKTYDLTSYEEDPKRVDIKYL